MDRVMAPDCVSGLKFKQPEQILNKIRMLSGIYGTVLIIQSLSPDFKDHREELDEFRTGSEYDHLLIHPGPAVGYRNLSFSRLCGRSDTALH